MSQNTETVSAYLTTTDDCGDKTLDIIPGAEGSGLAPILTVPVPFTGEDDSGDPIVDMEQVDAILREHGFRTIKTHNPGGLDQPGHWTATAYGWIASLEQI